MGMNGGGHRIFKTASLKADLKSTIDLPNTLAEKKGPPAKDEHIVQKLN